MQGLDTCWKEGLINPYRALCFRGIPKAACRCNSIPCFGQQVLMRPHFLNQPLFLACLSTHARWQASCFSDAALAFSVKPC